MKITLKFLCIVSGLCALPIGASMADEKFESPEHWAKQGYLPVMFPAISSTARSEMPPWAPHSLAWPVEFEDSEHSLGNSATEFQNYSNEPYYHGGCDLRVRRGAGVKAVVSGRIEAGHYGYSRNPDGSTTKHWLPWPQPGGDPYYFEVAIVTSENFRMEFHHMDETKLSQKVLKILKSGKAGFVSVGDELGQTVPWPDGVYHHTHYNIRSPSGAIVNPTYYSPLIPDHEKPMVSVVLAKFPNGKVQEFGKGEFSMLPESFVLGVIDHQDGNVYDHPPVRAGIEFSNGKNFIWDFRERLLGPDGIFPPLWSFYVESIRAPSGKKYETHGRYGEGLSVVRVPVPSGSQGSFLLHVSDEAGNETRFSGKVN